MAGNTGVVISHPKVVLSADSVEARPKELLYALLSGRIEILVPKARGKGFLKAPLGHHQTPVAEIASDLGYDIVGLDGALEVYRGGLNRMTETEIERAVAILIPALTKHYGYPARLLTTQEFWSLHPIKTNGAKYGG